MSRRVLVIDDDELVRRTLSLALRASGYDCSTASNTLNGIALAEEGRFDIALIDINMPGLDGFEAVKAIAHIKPRIAIVVMSGRPGKDDQEYGVLATGMGAHAFMLKPFTRNDLFVALEAAVKARPPR
jgi:two-component system copper resistance phosphate regulon response regulator CusR